MRRDHSKNQDPGLQEPSAQQSSVQDSIGQDSIGQVRAEASTQGAAGDTPERPAEEGAKAAGARGDSRVNTGATPRPQGRAGASRKGKVLHTRISESLDEEIKQRAQTLGMSVSTVVRNVLASTFDLVENVVHDSAQSIADETAGAGRTRRPGGPPTSSSHRGGSSILGWQEAKLQVNAVCERCNTILEKGTLAAIAVREEVGPRTIVCVACETQLLAEGEDLLAGE